MDTWGRALKPGSLDSEAAALRWALAGRGLPGATPTPLPGVRITEEPPVCDWL